MTTTYVAAEIEHEPSSRTFEAHFEFPADTQIERFTKNPVVLWAHGEGEDELPIGRADEITPGDGTLHLRVQLSSDDRGSQFAACLDEHILRYAELRIDDGELMECSLVSLPPAPPVRTDARTVARTDAPIVFRTDSPTRQKERSTMTDDEIRAKASEEFARIHRDERDIDRKLAWCRNDEERARERKRILAERQLRSDTDAALARRRDASTRSDGPTAANVSNVSEDDPEQQRTQRRKRTGMAPLTFSKDRFDYVGADLLPDDDAA